MPRKLVRHIETTTKNGGQLIRHDLLIEDAAVILEGQDDGIAVRIKVEEHFDMGLYQGGLQMSDYMFSF